MLKLLHFHIVLFVLINLLLHSSIDARIFSSFNEEPQSPKIVEDLRFLSFLKRIKRQTVETTTNQNKSVSAITLAESILGNETSHNQALIHWSGNYSNVIFILTRRKDSSNSDSVTNSVLWRSDDYGRTYVDQSSKFFHGTVLKSYYTDPNNKSKVVFIGWFGNKTSYRIWVTTDEGKSYHPYSIPYPLDKILFHPNKQDLLLGYSKKTASLYASIDLGKTWNLLQSGVTEDRYYWYKEGLDEDENIVFMEYIDISILRRPYYFVKTCAVPHCKPTRFQNMCDLLGPIEEKSLLVQDDYVFVQKSGALEKLYVSYKRNQFIKARFHGNGEQTDIHVISSHSNTVVVGINHDNAVTNLYFSDVEGRDFALSLEDVRYFSKKTGSDQVFTVDIHEVKGVKGSFLANKRVHGLLNKTMITWDNGRTWTYISASNNEIDSGCKDCTINLHLAMSRTSQNYFIPSMLSKESAPGVIIAHGSLGNNLDNIPGRVFVYVSNDTGFTWRKAIPGRNFYIMGDHGSIILSVSLHYLKPVQNISFSNDYGATWKVYTFSKEKIFVDGILTEPGENTHHFTLFGHKSPRASWRIFSLDMSSAFTRNCSYPQDFRNISLPFNHVGDCHLGMNRIMEAVSAPGCLIGKSFTRKSSVKACDCTNQDYECGFEYYRISKKLGCLKLNPQIDWIDDAFGLDDSAFTKMEPPCVDGFRNITTSYRKIPGDICVNDVPGKLYVLKKCNASSTTSTTSSTTSTTQSSTTRRTTTTSLPDNIKLKLMNHTRIAEIGKSLQIKSLNNATVKWKVTYLEDGGNDDHSKLVVDGILVTVYGHMVGRYLVEAIPVENHSNSEKSQVVIEFYYSIASITLWHPPVVTVHQSFGVTAYLNSSRGFPGIKSVLGNVSYKWIFKNKLISGGNSVELIADSVGLVPLKVTAHNKINYVSDYKYVHVVDRVEIVELLLVPSFPINQSMLNADWLKSVTELLASVLFKNIPIVRLLSVNLFLNQHNFHVYIPAEIPLRGNLIFLKVHPALHSTKNMKQVASEVSQMIMDIKPVLNLTNNQNITVYTQPKPGSGPSTATIVLSVLLCMVLVVSLVLLARRYGRLNRLRSYFPMRGIRPSFTFSRILRPRHNYDRHPIVNEQDDDYLDGELEDMENIESPHDGTLQFQT